MASIRELSNITGFGRDAIRSRVKRWNLGDNPDPKKILMLRPLDEAHQRSRTLEEQRTEESFEATRLKRFQADEKEGKLADVDELLTAINDYNDRITATIKTSDLSDDRKEDIFTALRDQVRLWGERFG